jgi:ketosteroid isomerase-like protein
VTTPAAATPSSEEVFEAVESWARAWSSKDVDAYLAAYAADFKTPQGEPRAAWEKVRRQRIASPKSITVTIDGPKMTVVAPDRVQVDFNQLYRSDIVSTSLTTKTLVLVKADGRWRIQQEIATN